LNPGIVQARDMKTIIPIQTHKWEVDSTANDTRTVGQYGDDIPNHNKISARRN